MAYDCGETQGALSAQSLMFRLAVRDHGITHKMIHLSTRMSLSSIGEYSRGETVMGLVALRKLSQMKEFPSNLLSLLLGGTDRHIVDGDDDAELDTLGENADAVATEVRRARHPQSPGGVDIVPEEESQIREKVVQLRRRVG
jgi:hypothetical protein